MNPRILSRERRGLACAFGPVSMPVWQRVRTIFLWFTKGLNGACFAGNRAGKAVLTGRAVWAKIDVMIADFPFYSWAKPLESDGIKTQNRGFAVCVNQFFFLPQWPLSVLLAAFPTTRIRQPITPLCAQLAGPQQGPLLPTQRAAAKPKARWLVPLSVAFRAACRACPSATNSGLTAARKRGVTIVSRPFGVVPRVAFLHFRADGAFPKGGCHV